MTKTVGVILAAGGSCRLGRPKQLLPWNQTTLLNHVIEQVLQAGCEHCFVVLGCRDQQIESSIPTTHRGGLTILRNKVWKQGQSTSFHLGVRHVQDTAKRSNVLVTLCDQPGVSITHYERLIDSVNDSAIGVSATAYEDGGGVPACFAHRVLPSLTDPSGDRGARRWIRSRPADQIKIIDCPDAHHDIDTIADYQSMSGHQLEE